MINQILQSLISGTTDLIPDELIEKVIKAVLGSKKKVVKYISKGTLCPVCRRFGLFTVANVSRKVGNLRYMDCSRCGCTFAAYCDDEPEKPKKPKKSARKSKKRTKKQKK